MYVLPAPARALVVNPAVELALLKQLRQLVTSCRRYQRAWFADGDKRDLGKAKESERAVDGLLRRLDHLEHNPGLFAADSKSELEALTGAPDVAGITLASRAARPMGHLLTDDERVEIRDMLQTLKGGAHADS